MRALREKMREVLRDAHRNESGAIVLLLLAAFLIIFMTALVLYDTGDAARDKMDAQISADTAAFSQAAIKSRSMNMIAYANVAKRTFYAFDTMYSAAYLGMIAAAAGYSAACGFSDLKSCFKAIKGWAQVAVEAIEFAGSNVWTMGAAAGGRTMASAEVLYLDRYSEYINAIAPWWGWAEATTRAMRNGATLSASWPPPPGNISGVNAWWVKITQFVDKIFDTSYYDYYPSSGAKDGLPIEKADNKWLAHVRLCAGTALSTEYLWFWGEHYVKSSGFARDSAAVIAGIFATPLGCMAASILLGDEVLPYELKSYSYAGVGADNTSSDWLKSTSNIVLSYKMETDRFDDEGARRKYGYLSKDYEEASPLAKGGGYFAFSKSEIVYSGGILSSAIGNLQGSFDDTGNVDSALNDWIGGLRDIFDQPNMWAARWTARMRPMQLDGEDMPRTDAMFLDMLPYMILTSPIAFANSPSSFSLSGARGFKDGALMDLAFIYAATYGHGQTGGGFVK